ncbi:MAG: amidohydrolase family protein [Acidimicrobiales bacterium]
MPGRPPSKKPLSRRRVLLALGYGGVNVALVRSFAETSADTSDVEATSPTASSQDTTLPDGAGLEAPPLLDDAVEIVGPDHVFDLVIANGRVIDPESGFDAIANVGINGSVITAVSKQALAGTETIDATGRVVSPGFIDVLSSDPNGFGDWFKIGDGVTTNLCMHGINNYANAFFNNLEGKTPCHYGGAFHQHFMRGEDEFLSVQPTEALSPNQIASFQGLALRNIGDGFAGICFSPEYSPGTSTDELLGLVAVAQQVGHSCWFHVRFSDPDEPGTSFEAIQEVLDLARVAKVPVHIEHITSTGGTFVMKETLELLEAARAEGIDVTACVYPYDYWGTTLASERFVAGWQDRYRITFEDLQIAGTETRLTEATFAEAQSQNLLVAAHGSIPEDELIMCLQTPWIMIGSDGIIEATLNNHPRGAGTFSRVLGHYVRDRQVLSLHDAVAKMTILPAWRVETMIPAMRRKGRLQAGADADVVVFDPATIADTATVAQPAHVGWNRLCVCDGPRRSPQWRDRPLVAARSGTKERSSRLGRPC